MQDFQLLQVGLEYILHHRQCLTVVLDFFLIILQ